MSNSAISTALETALAAISGSYPTAWENVDFSPPQSAYQVATILFAQPENPTMGSTFFRQRGYMQVQLRFPLGEGKQPAVARAEAIRAAFPRGSSFTANGVTTTIERSVEIMAGYTDENRFIVNVKIWFFANIGA
jgi:hypothetical protein